MATAYANTHHIKLCFSTWVCPEWTVAAIIDGMQTYGYEGVELRIDKDHQHGVELDSPADYLADVRKQFDTAKRAVACIATSFSFGSPDIVDRQKTIKEVKTALRMADSLGAPYVRIFGGDIPHGLEVTGVIDYVADALDECTEFIDKEKLRTTLLLETYGPFSHSKYVNEVLSQVYSKKLGVLWDVLHPMRVLEPAETTYENLGDHIRHIHVQDCAFNDDRTRLETCEPGEGFVPIPQIIDLLKAGNYRGYLSLEAMDEGADPDEILPLYSKYLRTLIKGEKE